MYGPRFARCKQVRDELVSNVDFMPTFLETAGIDAPLGLHGTSLVPLLNGDTPAWRSAVCIQNRLGKDGQKENVTSRGVRTRDWKLILRDSIPERGEHLRELYSHINDPLEHNTIYGRQNAETISSLLLEMDYWARQIDDKKAINLSAECARDLELA